MIKKAALSFATLALVGFSSIGQAAVWQDPYTGHFLGNICQGTHGWQFVPARPVGATCFTPTFGRGFIASW